MIATDSQAKIVTREEAANPVTVTPTKRSAAQRQRDYRLRRKRAVIEAIGEEASASRVALLTLLARDLAALEDRDNSSNRIASRRSSVKRVLNAIVTRYVIDLSD